MMVVLQRYDWQGWHIQEVISFQEIKIGNGNSLFWLCNGIDWWITRGTDGWLVSFDTPLLVPPSPLFPCPCHSFLLARPSECIPILLVISWTEIWLVDIGFPETITCNASSVHRYCMSWSCAWSIWWGKFCWHNSKTISTVCLILNYDGSQMIHFGFNSYDIRSSWATRGWLPNIFKGKGVSRQKQSA